MELRVTLPIFDGPLDLLLHLVRRRELDVCDVALAEVADAYVRHVRALRELAPRVDLDELGGYLVIAATLVEAKSARLLPAPPKRAQDDAGLFPDPAAEARSDLVRQLLEYRRFKEAAGDLDARQSEFSKRFGRVPAPRDDTGDPPPLALEELHAWDLLATFERLMREVGTRGPATHDVAGDDGPPLALVAADVADRVARSGRLRLRDLLAPCRSRMAMIGVFLALLELARGGRVRLRIGDAYNDLEVLHVDERTDPSPGPPEPDPAAGAEAGGELRPGEDGQRPDLRQRPTADG